MKEGREGGKGLQREEEGMQRRKKKQGWTLIRGSGKYGLDRGQRERVGALQVMEDRLN